MPLLSLSRQVEQLQRTTGPELASEEEAASAGAMSDMSRGGGEALLRFSARRCARILARAESTSADALREQRHTRRGEELSPRNDRRWERKEMRER